VRGELAQILQEDNSRIGEVYRGLARNLSAEEIAAELDVSTSNFVWNYGQTIRALLEGELPTAPTVALGAARKFRSLLRRITLSTDASSYLESTLVELENRASNPTARVVEVEEAQRQTERAEARNDVGIYAYALPHYLLHPYEPNTGRTLMKVGRSDSDVIQRFRNQTRTTALPEEPILLRVYPTGERPSAEVESDFHRLLEAADHSRSVARTAGREWFVTSLRFLDEAARIMRLPVIAVNEATIEDD
jgi:hypothetical protein